MQRCAVDGREHLVEELMVLPAVLLRVDQGIEAQPQPPAALGQALHRGDPPCHRRHALLKGVRDLLGREAEGDDAVVEGLGGEQRVDPRALGAQLEPGPGPVAEDRQCVLDEAGHALEGQGIAVPPASGAPVARACAPGSATAGASAAESSGAGD